MNDETKLPPSPSRLQRLAMEGQANAKIFTLLNNKLSMCLQIIPYIQKLYMYVGY
jgi:hypothetical protein